MKKDLVEGRDPETSDAVKNYAMMNRNRWFNLIRSMSVCEGDANGKRGIVGTAAAFEGSL